MTELDLYKFIKNNKIEYNDIGDEILMFIDFWLLEEFVSVAWSSYFDEEWQEVTMKDHYIVIDAVSLCDYHWIDEKNIFKLESVE